MINEVIDAHVHIVGRDLGGEAPLLDMLRRRSMRWMSPCWLETEEALEALVELAERVCPRHPERLSWAVSFSLRGFGEPDWAEAAIADVERGIAAGAVGVKVWKNIGMTLRENGRYVMIDDPRFDPVLDHVESRGLTLAAHIGEPRNCWLPLEEMTVEADRSYFGMYPKYHGLNLPDMPGYEAQIASRDALLERHPRLRVVGCHLGSLEYDVERLARTLDRYPNFAVDTSGRICHFQAQDREKVRDFLVAYRDRVLYGTDEGVDLGRPDLAEQVKRIERVYDDDLRYFRTDELMETPRVAKGHTCRGLGLPEDVLRKIFHDNALRWYPGMAAGGG